MGKQAASREVFPENSFFENTDKICDSFRQGLTFFDKMGR